MRDDFSQSGAHYRIASIYKISHQNYDGIQRRPREDIPIQTTSSPACSALDAACMLSRL